MLQFIQKPVIWLTSFYVIRALGKVSKPNIQKWFLWLEWKHRGIVNWVLQTTNRCHCVHKKSKNQNNSKELIRKSRGCCRQIIDNSMHVSICLITKEREKKLLFLFSESLSFFSSEMRSPPPESSKMERFATILNSF